MTRRTLSLGLIVVLTLTATLLAADWPQWRGPNRNGLVPDSPPLVDSFPAEGLKPLWISEEIQGGNVGGWGSVSVVGPRAYVFSSWNFKTPIPTRTLSADVLAQLGYAPEMPPDLSREVESARTSPERIALRKQNEINNWAAAWIKTHEKPETKRFRGAVEARLRAGDRAVSLETLAKLPVIVDKEFPTRDALNAWFTENGIPDSDAASILRAIPSLKPEARDFLYCLDPADGKTLFKTELPGLPLGWPASSTPTVLADRVYLLNSEAIVYCLDALKGNVLWKSPCVGNPKYDRTHAGSVLATPDTLYVVTETGLSALKTASGELLWSQPAAKSESASAILVDLPNRGPALLAPAGGNTLCLDPANGKILWKIPGGGASTPVVVGDTLVLVGVKAAGLSAWSLAADKPVKLWSVPFDDEYASPLVANGLVFVVGEQTRALCVTLADGKVAWEGKLEKGAGLATPLLADGKIIVTGGPWLYSLRASADSFQLLGKADVNVETWIAPSLADGKVYVRTKHNIVCYNLSR